MPPKEIVQREFEDTITPWLESLGFEYVRSRFSYKRKVEEFEQRISVTLSHRNSAETINFWSAFNVASRKYNQWLKTQRRPRFTGYLGGCADWNVPGWRADSDRSTHFDFGNPTTRPQIIAEWRRRCEAAGIPYLNALSSWEGAADDLLRCCWHYDRAADFFLIAGQPDRALRALAEGVRSLDQQDFSWTDKSHPILIAKKKRQAQDRDSKRQVLEDRIHDLRNSEPRDEREPE